MEAAYAIWTGSSTAEAAFGNLIYCCCSGAVAVLFVGACSWHAVSDNPSVTVRHCCCCP
jgi:hypothetical protein